MFALKCPWPSSAVAANVKHAGLPVGCSAWKPLYRQTLEMWGIVSVDTIERHS